MSHESFHKIIKRIRNGHRTEITSWNALLFLGFGYYNFLKIGGQKFKEWGLKTPKMSLLIRRKFPFCLSYSWMTHGPTGKTRKIRTHCLVSHGFRFRPGPLVLMERR